MNIEKVAVIGAGTMGNGIAHVFAQNGYSVQFIDLKEEYLDKGLKSIKKNLDRQIKKEIITEEIKESTLNNISSIVGVENISKDNDLVVEAIIEEKDAKIKIFKQLNDIIKVNSILASNTSSIEAFIVLLTLNVKSLIIRLLYPLIHLVYPGVTPR